MLSKLFRKTPLALAVSAAIALVSSGGVSAFESTHTFSVDDIIGDFSGSMYGTAGNQQDLTILCDLDVNQTTCPDGVAPFQDKAGNWLYPIDSTFGFYIVDFAMGIQKVRDGDYAEGFAGNVYAGDEVIGLAVSNAATDTFRVPPPLGSWCAGLGNTSVKCSTEHYVVMEHVKSCHETIPYIGGDPSRADPETGEQAVLTDPTTGEELTYCADTKLDNVLEIIGGVFEEEEPYSEIFPASTQIVGDQILYDGVDGFLLPNESTVLDNIAASNDYSVTAKDDGKPLYRWGDLVKRPNDIRFYARMALPLNVWTTVDALGANGGLGLRVYRAELHLNHLVTNNPNDQVRPEDMENEGAIGRKPGAVADWWAPGLISDTDCYEGDGDFIAATSTLMTNTNFGSDYLLDPTDGDPYAWSEDLQEGFTNGWYTTVDREPFEWAYDAGVVDGSPDVSSPYPDDSLGTLISGPRWRLTAQKFGQDVPGLEIPVNECTPPPYQKDNIKYQVGAPYTTILNLLDWAPDDERSVTVPLVWDDAGEAVSPLAFSNGWVDHNANGGAVAGEVEVDSGAIGIDAISINGSPMTKDLDLTLYVKGDKKPTAVYSARLVIEYEDEVGGTVPGAVDMAAVTLSVPGKISAQNPLGRTKPILFTVRNEGTAPASGTVEVKGESTVSTQEDYGFGGAFTDLGPGQSETFEWSWTAPAEHLQVINWTGTVAASGDDNIGNDSASAETIVQPLRK